MPGAFGLSQIYPNPFNPSTVIAYQLSRPADIRMDVHDLEEERTVWRAIEHKPGACATGLTDGCVAQSPGLRF